MATGTGTKIGAPAIAAALLLLFIGVGDADAALTQLHSVAADRRADFDVIGAQVGQGRGENAVDGEWEDCCVPLHGVDARGLDESEIVDSVFG